MHARKISFDGGANGDLQVMRELGYPKNMTFYQKWSRKGSNWSPKRSKWRQNAAKWSRKDAQIDQSGAKEEPKSTKSDAKGAKTEPKGDQNAFLKAIVYYTAGAGALTLVFMEKCDV